MYVINPYVSFAICLTVVLVVSVAVFRWQRASAVRRRVLRMMLTFGIDAQTARNADALPGIDMNAVRRRCHRCPAPHTCERWLNGETVPGNDFCPNAPVFATVAQTRQRRVHWNPRVRPGRRLDG